VQALAAACPIAVKMIDRGEISLKNKEERALFSDPAGFMKELGTLSEKYTSQMTEYEAVERLLRSNPVLAQSENLKREKNQLEVMQKKEIQSSSDLIVWRGDLRQSISGLQQRMEKEMGEISGGDVQIQYPQILASSP
jgi:recombinational DNA repair ATPase RecF